MFISLAHKTFEPIIGLSVLALRNKMWVRQVLFQFEYFTPTSPAVRVSQIQRACSVIWRAGGRAAILIAWRGQRAATLLLQRQLQEQRTDFAVGQNKQQFPHPRQNFYAFNVFYYYYYYYYSRGVGYGGRKY
jgi:hypothetical protein